MSKPRSYHYTGTKGHIKDVVSSLPDNYAILLKRGWYVIPVPEAEKFGHFRLREKESGLIVVYDKEQKGVTGWRGKNHYHIYNFKAKNDRDMYLDKDGNPVGKHSPKSHIATNII